MRKLLIGLVMLTLLAAGTWYLWQGLTLPFGSAVLEVGETPPQSDAAKALEPVVFPQREVPTGYKEYQNVPYRFSLLYIDTMSVQEFEEVGGGVTITFEDISDPQNLKGFQLFARPHTGGEVTVEFIQARIGKTPTAVEQVSIDGAQGLAFVSIDPTFGEVREVWFVRSGYFYQAAAPRPLELLLHEALQTWDFV